MHLGSGTEQQPYRPRAAATKPSHIVSHRGIIARKSAEPQEVSVEIEGTQDRSMSRRRRSTLHHWLVYCLPQRPWGETGMARGPQLAVPDGAAVDSVQGQDVEPILPRAAGSRCDDSIAYNDRGRRTAAGQFDLPCHVLAIGKLDGQALFVRSTRVVCAAKLEPVGASAKGQQRTTEGRLGPRFS